jgi:hypothetical protein
LTQHVPITIERCPLASTGAAASFAGLSIISIERGVDRFVIVPDRSAHFVLDDSSQQALRRFQREVESFLDESCITGLVLRVGATKGPRRAGPDIARMHAALELLPRLTVHHVDHLSLRPFVQIHRKQLPEPYPTVPLPIAQLHDYAIGAARLSHAIECEGVRLVERCVRGSEAS